MASSLKSSSAALRAKAPFTRAQSAVCEVDCVHSDQVQRARDNSPPDMAIASLAETFKTLGDPTRLRIVAALEGQELCVCDIAAVLGASQSAVSHSLRALRQLRLVRYRKAGKIAYYSLDDAHISILVREGLRHVAEADLNSSTVVR